jgi:hypothetical protein
MAERVMVVCDVCGAAPAETVAITAKDRSYRKDLCSTHLSQLLEGARAPRRGRPRKGEAAPAANATPQAAPRRRGRPPKSASAPAAASKPATSRKRGPITDPVILQKRRDALAKARAARAAKRAAAAKS